MVRGVDRGFPFVQEVLVRALELAGVDRDRAALVVGHERGFTFGVYNPEGLDLSDAPRGGRSSPLRGARSGASVPIFSALSCPQPDASPAVAKPRPYPIDRISTLAEQRPFVARPALAAGSEEGCGQPGLLVAPKATSAHMLLAPRSARSMV